MGLVPLADLCDCGMSGPVIFDMATCSMSFGGVAVLTIAPINPLPTDPGRYFRAPGEVWRRVSRVSFALLKWRGFDGEYAVVEGRGR